MKNAFRILGFVLSLLGSSASGEVRSWKGGGESGLWSLAANWSNGIPQNGDSILLPRHPLGFTTSAINDLTNIVIARIICESQRYTLTGGEVQLTQGLEVRPSDGIEALLVISCPMRLTGTSMSFLSRANSGLSFLAPIIAGPEVNLTLEGLSHQFRPGPGSDFRASLHVLSGSLAIVNSPRAFGGPITVGGGPSGASLIIQSGSLTFGSPPLTVRSNGSVMNIATVNTFGPLSVSSGTLTLGGTSPQGRLAVDGDALFENGTLIRANAFSSGVPGEISVTGRVHLASCRLEVFPEVSLQSPSVLIRNDGNDAVVGTFTGLPEGALVSSRTRVFQLSYQGGDGNDVVLIPRGTIVIQSINRVDDSARVSGMGPTATNIVLEVTGQLPADNWVLLGETTTDAQGRFQWTSPLLPPPQNRFYRAAIR